MIIEALRDMLIKWEAVILVSFCTVVAFGWYVIIYFNILRFRGLITTGYKITRSSFDIAISRTTDERDLKRLKYGKDIYLIFLYAMLFVALPLVTLWALLTNPAK